MDIEKQREYVNMLESKYLDKYATWPKTNRYKFGLGGKAETALIDDLVEARMKLREMEDNSQSY